VTATRGCGAVDHRPVHDAVDTARHLERGDSDGPAGTLRGGDGRGNDNEHERHQGSNPGCHPNPHDPGIGTLSSDL